MGKNYSLGLDFGTGSVRAVIVDVSNGKTAGEAARGFSHGAGGVITDLRDSNLARQHPGDYLEGLKIVIKEAVEKAEESPDFNPGRIIGIGVDTTGSSPMPLDKDGNALIFHNEFSEDPDAMVWLWKDHTSHAEAAAITETAKKHRPEYLSKIGGTYSSEWFWAKIWRCLKVNPGVFRAAFTWVEYADWIPAVLTGTNDPRKMKRGVCAAGHKGLYHEDWGGYPEPDFLKRLDPRLAELRSTLPEKTYTSNEPAGYLTGEWSEKLGLSEGIPVAVGALDAHFGGIGAGIGEGIMVKNIGTSCCDMLVASLDRNIPDIPGLAGIVPGSILPDKYGFEAGQSAIGDIFSWFTGMIAENADEKSLDKTALFLKLTSEAETLRPGQSGLMALDWMNGNRTILMDQRLTGLFAGITLHTTAAEMYRALIEATAFGARIILERFEEYGARVDRVINCGGIPYKSPMLMQIYADVFNRTMELSASEQTAALGSAIAGAVAAGADRGGYENFQDAMASMTGTLDLTYKPVPENVKMYDELFSIYREVHDSFGIKGSGPDLYPVMKKLLEIKDKVSPQDQVEVNG